MARPNRDRIRISLWVSREAHLALRRKATAEQVPIAAIYRRLLKKGLDSER